jgi:hypothetical protein
MAMGFDSALEFVRGLRLYETKVLIERGAMKLESVVNEVGVINDRACFRVDGSREWFTTQDHKTNVFVK